jgi:hypothetical protein
VSERYKKKTNVEISSFLNDISFLGTLKTMKTTN